MRAPPLLLLIGITSCGDNLAPDPGQPRSGTRLKLIRHVYEDGTAQLVPGLLHDVRLDARCTPEVWSDGHTYCTPAAGETVFIEPTCTVSRGQVLRPAEDVPGEVPPYFLRRFELDDARRPSRLYRPVRAIVPPDQIYYLRRGGCQGPVDPGFVADYVELAEVPAARIRSLDRPVGDRLELGVHESDDGLHVPIGWRDRELDIPCRVEGAACAPVAAHPAAYFHDPACSQPELAVNPGATPPPFVRARDPVTGCATYHLVGEPVTAPPLYLHTGRVCQSVTVPGSEQFYLAGAALALPVLGRARDEAAGRRLQPIVLTAGEVRVDDTVVYDAQLETECRAGLVGDAIRCAPVTEIAIVYHYADEQCGQPLALAEVPLAACASPAKFAIATTVEGSPLHAIGERHTGPIFHLSTGARCLPFVPGEQRAFHAIGPALTSELAAAVTEVDL